MPMLDPAMFDPDLVPPTTAFSPSPWTGLSPFEVNAEHLRRGTVRGRQEMPPAAVPDATQWNSGASPVPFMDAGPSAAPVAPPPAKDAGPEAAPPLPPPQSIGMLNNPSLPPPLSLAAGDYAQAGADDVPPVRSASGDVPPTSLLGRLGGSVKDLLGGTQNWIGDHRATLAALGAGLMGSQNIGHGLQRAGQLIPAATQQDIAQQKVNQTAQWLVGKGMSPQEAQAVVNNPEMLKQLLPRLMGARQLKWTQTGEDFMGNKTFNFVDEASGKVYDQNGREIGAGGGGGGGMSIPTGPDGQPIQGEALMRHLERSDPAAAAGIKGLISGDINAAGRNMQKLAPLAKLVDPSFDATQYPIRLATRKSYTSGKDFQESQALNTVSGHMAKLMESADKLPNGDWPIINRARNWFADTFTGSPALVKFRNDLVTTQNELAKAYHGGHVSDSAFAAFNKSINEAQTPAEMKAAIGELADLLHSKIEAKESGYRSSMGPTPLPEEYRATNQHAREAFSRIGDWARGMPAVGATTGAAAATVAPEAPKVGTVKDGYRYKGGNPGDPHSWEPVK